jgi:hypothetical protein
MIRRKPRRDPVPPELTAALTDGIAYAIVHSPVPTRTDTVRDVAARLAPLIIESGCLDAAGLDVDEGNWQPGYSEEFKRGFMTAIHEGLDPQTLAMAMDIAADTPIFDTGLTRADVVVREYERLRS